MIRKREGTERRGGRREGDSRIGWREKVRQHDFDVDFIYSSEAVNHSNFLKNF